MISSYNLPRFNLHFCRVKANWLRSKSPPFRCSRPPSPRRQSYPRSKDSLGYPAACWPHSMENIAIAGYSSFTPSSTEYHFEDKKLYLRIPKKIESKIRSHSDNLLFYLFEITVNVVGYLTKIRTQLAVRVQQQLHHCDAVGTDGVAQRGDALVVLPVGVAHE